MYSTTLTAASSLDSIKYHKIIWNICGYCDWPSGAPPLWYTVYRNFVILFFLLCFPLGMIIKLTMTTDLFEAIDTMLFLLTALGGLKIWLVMHQKPLLHRIVQLLQTLDRQNYDPGDVDQQQQHQIINAGIRRGQRVNLMLCLVYYSSTVLLYVTCLIDNNHGQLMWSFYFPYDYANNAYVYHGLLFYQFAGTLFSAIIHSSVDSLAGSFYCVIGSHLELLGKRLENLGVGVPRIKSHKRPVMAELRQDGDRELAHCVQIHLMCVE